MYDSVLPACLNTGQSPACLKEVHLLSLFAWISGLFSNDDPSVPKYDTESWTDELLKMSREAEDKMWEKKARDSQSSKESCL